MRLDISSDTDEVLGRVPSHDVLPIPGRADRFLVTLSQGGEDFASDPRLVVIDEIGRQVASLGAGFGPLVHPSGDRVAYLRSVGERVCEGEICLGSVTVQVADIEGRGRRVLSSGDWHLLAWAGEGLIVGAAGVAHRVTMDGDMQKLDAAPDEIWGATPDGEELLFSRADGAAFVDPDTGAERSLSVRGLLAEGEWGPEGEELIAVVVRRGGTQLVRISAEDAAVSPIPASQGASGPILWAADGSFAYVRADGLQLEAMYCTLEEACRPVLRWTEGITPLALQ